MRMRRLAGRSFTAATGLLLAAGAFAAPGLPAASAARCQAWTGAQPPSPGTVDNALNTVAVLSPCDVWAAGFDISGGGGFQTLIERWNGFSWAQVDSPDPGSGNNFLNSIRAASPSSVWAVGSFSDGTSSKTLIEHWNGTTWKTVPSPSPGNAFNDLNGVRVVSASDAWAVGDYANGGTSKKTLILHWNGATWKQVISPNPGGPSNDNYLFAAATTSAHDAWAVGEIVTSTGIRTLILHWNGTRWAHVPSPNPGTGNELMGVGATSASNAWAVGNVAAPTTQQTLVLHWNGSKWAQVASPDPGGPAKDNRLNAVAVTSTSSAWAVGSYENGTGQRNIVMHWDGHRWVHVATPGLGTSSGLSGVAATSASTVWAVGFFGTTVPFQALALHCC
jgi:hypothetical protein